MRLTTFAQGVILALASAALSAVQYPLYKGALSGGLSNVTTALLESAFTIVFCMITFGMRRQTPRVVVSWSMLIVGILNVAGVILLFSALGALGPATVGFFGRLYVCFALLAGAIVLVEKPKGIDLGSSLLLVAGLLAFSHDGAVTGLSRPILIAIAYPALFALQNVVVKRFLSAHSPVAVLLSQKLISAISIGCYLLMTRRDGSVISITNVSVVAVGTLFSAFLSLLAYYSALRRIDFTTANLMRGTSPLFVLAMSAPFFPLSVDWISAVGIVLVSISAIMPGAVNFIQKIFQEHAIRSVPQ